MRRTLCYRCNDYKEIPGHDDFLLAYQKPVEVAMIPVYVNKQVEGKKRKWVRCGFLCPRCYDFLYTDPSVFKPKRHAL